MKKQFIKYRDILLYAVSMALFIFGLKWMQWKFLIADHAFEIYGGLIAILFTLLGIWMSHHLSNNKRSFLDTTKNKNLKSINFHKNEVELEKLNLSNREYEILVMLTKGKSNAEIAKDLFISISTVKTHIYNLFNKMEINSRSKAIEMAMRLGLTN